MSLKYQNHKKSKILWLFLIFCVILIGNLGLNLFEFIGSNAYNTKFEENDISFDEGLNTAYQDLRGRTLSITQHATISKTYFPFSLPTNVSFTLLEGWTSKNVTISYDEVSHKTDWIVNGTFDDGESPWEYTSTNPSIIIHEPWQPENLEIMVQKNQALSSGAYGYFEENITITEPSATNAIATLSMDYFYSLAGGTEQPNMVAFVSINIGGVSKNASISFIDLVEDSWTKMSVNYDIDLAGQDLPDNATVRAGIYVINNLFTGPKEHYLSIDNIQFTVWTKPNKPNLIIANDVEFDQDYSYENITFGKGKTFINVERSRAETSEIEFTISKNDTITEDLEVYNITITSEAFKDFNSTVNGVVSSTYTMGSQINWQTECSITIPYGYTGNWAKIKKPSDWNVTSILDGYNSEKIESCTGYDLGSEALIIPKDVLNPGLWTIKAISQNYILEGSLNMYNGTAYEKKSRITFGDTFQINATIDNSISYQSTFMNCSIEFPNGSLFYQGSEELNSHDIEFGSFIVDENMPVGSYTVNLLWTNNISYLFRDKVGYFQLNFDIWHHTNLTPVESYFERVSGEPLLIKVNFTDNDLNTFIDFATITYDSTLGISGTMVYFGSGIYVADIDTSGIEIGEYYFSFNASKEFYENQTKVDLIQLNIIEQPLVLDFSSRVINSLGNSHAICRVTVKGEISDTPVPPPVNVSTDWDNGYSVIDYLNGTYGLNFSTNALPAEGVIEAFEIEVFANKTNYGKVSDFITLIIQPIHTTANANTTNIVTNINDIFKIKVNYTVDGSGEFISGGLCTVAWESNYEIAEVADGYVITYHTNDLNIDVYNSLIRISKLGYEDALVSITVLINEHEINMLVEINGDLITQNSLIELYFKENVNLTARVFTEPEGQYLTGGSFTILSNHYENILVETPATFFTLIININGENFSSGLNSIFLRYEKQNYTTKIFSFQFFIRAQEVILEVKIDNQNILENHLIERYDHENITVSCQVFAKVEEIYLTGASVKLIIGGYEIDFLENPNYWYNKTFRISLDIFSLGINSVYLKFELNNYTTTTFSFQFLVQAQEITLEVKIDNQNILENNLIERYEHESITISCQVFAKVEEIYLSGASVKLIIGSYEIDFLENPNYWYNKTFSISPDIFSLGINSVYLKFELNNYTTTTFSFQFYVLAQNVILEVKFNEENLLETGLIEIAYNNISSLSCRAFADVEEIYLTGASVKLIIGSYEIDFLENPYYWYNKTFSISPDIFSLGINSVYLKFELMNYSTTTFSFKIYVNQIELIIQTIDFIDSLSAYVGDSVSIRINLTEYGSNEPIENATIYCYWRYGSYYFSEISEGLYKLELDLSQSDIGTHRLYLVITIENIIYKTTQYSFLIIISERQLPNYLINIVVISLIGGISALGILSVRSYVILPRKRKINLETAEKTQPYKDIRNVEAIICSSKSSGLSLYNKTFSIIDDEYITGFSGFIQAITILEKQYTKKGTKKVEIESISEESEGDTPEIKELDFNFFNALICDYKNLRMILVLRELSSERLRNKIESLTIELYSQCEDTITQFKGNLNGINQKVEGILYKYLPLYYKEEFVLNKGTHYNSAKLSGELSKLETRFLNVLEAQSKFKPRFLLENMLSMIEDVSEDKKIIALESLIKQGLIKPAK